MKMLGTRFKSRRNDDRTTLPMTDFHELLPCSQLSDLTTTICNTVRPQLNSDRFNPAHDVALS